MFEKDNPPGQGDRPVGAAPCVAVPDVGDAAVYCPAYFIKNTGANSFFAVLAGSTRLSAFVDFPDAKGQAVEPKSKDKAIEFMRLILAP